MRSIRETKTPMPRNNRTNPDMGCVKRMLLYSACLFVLSGALTAAPATQPQMQREVVHLLRFVEESGCQFNRNNTWHNGKDARLHLEMKYDYLVRKKLIDKTEDFIERAASKSSLSGRDYQIRCQDGKIISSARWLSGELQRHRKSSNRK